MGQCGCNDPDCLYKLPAPGGRWYVIEMYHGCNECGDTPPHIKVKYVQQVSTHDFYVQLIKENEIPDLPFIPPPSVGGFPEAVISTGPKKESCVRSAHTDPEIEDLLEDMWDQRLARAPHVLVPTVPVYAKKERKHYEY